MDKYMKTKQVINADALEEGYYCIKTDSVTKHHVIKINDDTFVKLTEQNMYYGCIESKNTEMYFKQTLTRREAQEWFDSIDVSTIVRK